MMHGLIIIAGLALMLLLGAITLYVRPMIRWRMLINARLTDLVKEKKAARVDLARAMEKIEKTSRYLLSNSVDVSSFLSEIPNELRTMAAIFHPEALRPELRVTPAHIMACLHGIRPEIEGLKNRPGYGVLSQRSIHDIRAMFYRYKAWFRPNSKGMPPLGDFLTLLGQIHYLVYARLLLVDSYLVFGRFCMALYSEEAPYLMEESSVDLEGLLTELSKGPDDIAPIHDDALAAIRNRLVGVSSVIFSEPGPVKLKQAVSEAARWIAGRHFPESEAPLLEARLGPVVSRSLACLTALETGEVFPRAGKMLKIRLETLFQAKSISQALIPPQVRRLMMRTQKTYGWLKWPLNIYMMASKGMFLKIAVDVGWFAGRKAMLAIVFGKGFDMAVREIEIVYDLSVQENPPLI